MRPAQDLSLSPLPHLASDPKLFFAGDTNNILGEGWSTIWRVSGFSDDGIIECTATGQRMSSVGLMHLHM